MRWVVVSIVIMEWVMISIVSVIISFRIVEFWLVSPSVVSVVDGFWVVSWRGVLFFIDASSDGLNLSACFVSSCSFPFVNLECLLPLYSDMLNFVSVISGFPAGFRSRFSLRVDPIVGSSLLVGSLSSVFFVSFDCFGVLHFPIPLKACVLSVISTFFPVLFSGSISDVLFRFVGVRSVVFFIPGSKLRLECRSDSALVPMTCSLLCLDVA